MDESGTNSTGRRAGGFRDSMDSCAAAALSLISSAILLRLLDTGDKAVWTAARGTCHLRRCEQM